MPKITIYAVWDDDGNCGLHPDGMLDAQEAYEMDWSEPTRGAVITLDVPPVGARPVLRLDAKLEPYEGESEDVARYRLTINKQTDE